MRERRGRYDRRPIPGKVKLYWRPPEGGSQAVVGRARNISVQGMLVLVDRPVEVGTLVQLESSDFRLAGIAVVRHARRQALNWLVGLEFGGGLAWHDPHPTEPSV
jgi:hypothetical protein